MTQPPLEPLLLRLERLKGARDTARRRLQETTAQITKLEAEEETLDLVQGAFRALIDKEVTAGVAAVDKLLTEGLQAVFPDQKISVSSEITTLRGKVSVDMTTTYERPDGVVIQGPSSDAFGGAVTTVQSILLRLLVMHRRGIRPFLLLDETLPAFDANYAQNMGDFLRALCQRMGVDILLVSHNPTMLDAADNAYQIVRTASGARFEKVG